MLKLSIERSEAAASPPTRAVNPRLEIWRDGHGEVSAYSEIFGEEYRMYLPGVASFRFSCCGDEIAAAVKSSVSEDLVLDAYHRKVLPMALQACGREVLHASAIRSSQGVMAFCGTSETGKSTIAFGLGRRGYSLWADDAVAFDITDHGCSAISLPFNMRLRPPSANLFAVNGDGTSSSIPRNGGVPTLDTAPLIAVGVLRRADQTNPAVAVTRLSSVDAFGAVFNHACCFMPQADQRKRRMISNYLELLAAVPIFDICFQPGLANLPTILDEIERVVVKTQAS